MSIFGKKYDKKKKLDMLGMGDKLVEEGKFDDAFKSCSDILKADPNMLLQI